MADVDLAALREADHRYTTREARKDAGTRWRVVTLALEERTDMEQERRKATDPGHTQEIPKKPYAAPRLTVHGRVEDLTTQDADGSGLVPESDRNAKEHFAPVDPREILARVAVLPIETWNYKAQDPAIRHLGPMAQDFAAAFGVGEDDRHIHPIDASGVALAAIQGLHQLVEAHATQLRRLGQELSALQTENRALWTELHGLRPEVPAESR